MAIPEILSFSQGNLSYLRAWAVLLQLDGSYSTLSPVVYLIDIALSINTQYSEMVFCEVTVDRAFSEFWARIHKDSYS